jgi:hypothetical protein
MLGGSERPRVLDYGCGWGGFIDFLDLRGLRVDYTGFDIASEALEAARHRKGTARWESELPPGETWDFVVASGIFNVRLESDEECWERHLYETLEEFDARSRRGFAFNALTSYSDPDRRASHLYYADPCRLLDHCLRAYSSRVDLLHGNPPWDFTVLVRK